MFIYNLNYKTPFTNINNNLLMIKILKKVEVTYFKSLFETQNLINEYMLTNIDLITRVFDKNTRLNNKFSK